MQKLTEGLISVPPKMMASAINYVTRQVLWWARDRMKGRAKEFPQHAKELRLLLALHASDLPATPYGDIEEKKVRTGQLPFRTADLGPGYEGLTPKADHYLVAVNWAGRAAHGQWFIKHNALIVCPLSYDWMRRYPERRGEETLVSFLKEIESVVEHELRHGIQYMLLGDKAPQQIKTHQGYFDKKDSQPGTMVPYYMSPVEFDPTIGSCARSFMQEVDLNQSYGKTVDFGKAIRTFTGMIPSKSFTASFRTDPFFMVLKKKAPKRYLVAVKKFIAEIERLRDNPLGEGMIDSRVQLNEGAVPPTEYGYWISDQGEFIEVPFQSHFETLWGHVSGGYVGAYRAGWVRVVARPKSSELIMKFAENNLSTRTVSAIRRLAQSRDFASVVVDQWAADGVKHKTFNEIRPALAFVQSNRKPPRLDEVYQEAPGGKFTHDGAEYDLNALLKLLDDSEDYKIPLDALEWVLEWDEADPERLERADVTAPIIVTWWKDDDEDIHRLVVIDGLHRVKKALERDMEFIPGHYVDEDDLVKCLADRSDA